MTRPAGDPAALAAGSRSMAGAAAALREVRARLGGATSSVVVAGAWRGPASEAFQVDGAGFQTGLQQAADTLEQSAGALSELSARLAHAQATWDRAQRLAAGVGVALGPHPATTPQGGAVPAVVGSSSGPQAGAAPAALRSAWNPHGGVLSPADAVDPAAMLVAGQAVRMAAAAEHEAAAARRVAAARLDQAATVRVRVAGHRAARPPAGPRPPNGTRDPGGHPAAGTGSPEVPDGHGGDRHEGPVRRAVGRGLEAGAEVATATHHLVAAAEARAQAAGRLAATADDPAVRTAAGRVAQAAGQPLMDGRIMGALPLFAPVLDFTASVSHGEPLPRALAGAIGGAIGADLGGRIGLAACGGEAAATQGAGLIVCPALTAVGGALGAHTGKTAALHVYDKLAGPSDTPAAPAQPAPAGHAGPRSGTGVATQAPTGPAPPGSGPATPGSQPGSGG